MELRASNATFDRKKLLCNAGIVCHGDWKIPRGDGIEIGHVLRTIVVEVADGTVKHIDWSVDLK